MTANPPAPPVVAEPAPTVAPARAGPPRRRRRWLRPVRRTVLAVAVVVVLEYVVAPTLIGASRNLSLLGRVHPAWLLAAVLTEAAALAAYGLLTRAVLPSPRPSTGRLIRIVLATTALGHVVPAGGAGPVGVGYRLLTTSGVDGATAGFALATVALGSAVVLNVLLWLALVVSIPLAGFHPLYVVVALLGLLALSAAAALAYLFTRGEEGAVRVVRAVGRRIPHVGADRLETVIRDLATSLAELARDRRLLLTATGWAALNWLFDAASLWCFVAAFGTHANPALLFAAYGIANVLAAVPITPAGLGVIEASAPALLVSFGVGHTIATLGVLGWRLVNFWLPIPIGALAYASLRMPASERAARARERRSE